MRSHLVSLLVLGLGTLPAAAQDPPIRMILPAPSGGGLVVGTAVQTGPERWPATFVFSAGDNGCTATAVGPRVILTAAHCVGPNTGSGTADFPAAIVFGGSGSGPQSVSLSCTNHPEWPGERATMDMNRKAPDYALCVADTRLLMPEDNAGMRGFETISTDPAGLDRDAAVRLLGFGCRDAGKPTDFQRLFMGEARITRTPPSSRFIETSGVAGICPGDSGGAAYRETEGGDRRVIVGVNARAVPDRRQSYLASTADPRFAGWAQAWAQAWASRNGGQETLLICGVTGLTAECRR